MNLRIVADVRGRRRLTLVLFCLFVSYLYFYQAGGWNQNTRFAMVRAVVEEGRLAIDSFHESTGDKAHFGDHYYNDKAPGLSLLAIPIYWAARPVVGAYTDPRSPAGVALLSYVSTVLTSGLAGVGAALLIYLLCLRLGATPEGSIFAAVAFGLGTPAWAYATLFWGHLLTGTLLLLAFWCAVTLEDASRGKQRWLGLWLGLSAGWATLTEYTAAVTAIIIGCFALVQLWRRSNLHGLWTIVAGAAIAGLVLVTYNTATTGSPFTIGYSFYTETEAFEGMKEGFLGITYPKPRVAAVLLLSPYRGLFPIAPILALSFGALAAAIVFRVHRPIALTIGLIAAYYLWVNASYRYWDGGWSYGPRHMGAMLPFAAIPLGHLWSWCSRGGRLLLSLTAAWGVAMSLMAVAVTPQLPDQIGRPITALLLPAFLEGDLSVNHQSFDEIGADPQRLRGQSVAHDAWNLGQKAGLPGLTSLLPLGLLWAACALACRTLRR